MLILFFPAFAWAQEEEDEEYHTELSYGLNFNTNGGIIGGLMLRHATSINNTMFQTFGLEIVNVKHPKELRQQSPATGNSFIYGKQNYLFAIRPSYGREIILFRKAPEEGVRVNAIAAVGPSIGLIKPYYIAYAYSSTDTRVEQYDPEKHKQTSLILGSEGLTKFNGTNIGLGAHIKGGLSFELGGFRNSTTGFEAGFMLEAYTKKVVLLPTAVNRSIFPSAYLNIFYKLKK
jgi:hypothetical protein